MIGSTPPVVKNLLIINFLMFLATFVLESSGLDITEILALHHWSSTLFNPFQLVSYMFLHGNFMHIFFNMFALWMFGRILEQVWGSKRFLIYYMITGIGAAIIQLIFVSFDLNALTNDVAAFMNNPEPAALSHLLNENLGNLFEDPTLNPKIVEFIHAWENDPQNLTLVSHGQEIAQQLLNEKTNVGTVGASGSVFGLLLAFGMLFPNTELMLLFPPIPIKAKYFVFGYGAIELYMGIANNPGDNVAHFAHLGGMLFGYILIKYWKSNTTNFY